MKQFAAIVLLSIVLAGCDTIDVAGPPYPVSRTTQINIPASQRQSNWGPKRDGSCTHAATVMLLRHQGRTNMAEWWRAHHTGGETPDSLKAKLDAAGVRYSLTTTPDEAWLERAVATRRGAGLAINGGSHMVVIVGLDNQTAYFIDPNDTAEVKSMPRSELNWRWGLTPVFSPAPPLPQ